MDIEKRETEYTKEFLLLKQKKKKTYPAFQSLQNMGFKRSLRTPQRHIQAFNTTKHALKVVKKVRMQSSLNDEQIKIVDAWVNEQNKNNNPFHCIDVKKFIYESINIIVSERTACNILARLKHTKKTCQSKTSGYDKTNDKLKIEYINFITKMKNINTFYRKPKDIRSIDVTYTKKPPTRITTYSPKGGGQQRASSKVHLYTNAIVTMISGDGLNHTPCLLYTHDPKMSKEQKNTDRGKRIRSEFEEALQRYNITEDRIIYTKSDKNYYAESPDVYENFLDHYDIPKDTLILHDGGNAYKRQKTSIFDTKGFKNHVEYPTDVHQFLSPNDNKLHGCKTIWKEEYYKFKDDVSPSLRLMQLIDLDTVKNSKTYFQKNLFNVTKKDLDEIIGV